MDSGENAYTMPREKELRMKRAAVIDRLRRESGPGKTKPVKLDLREYRILSRTPSWQIIQTVKEIYENEDDQTQKKN